MEGQNQHVWEAEGEKRGRGEHGADYGWFWGLTSGAGGLIVAFADLSNVVLFVSTDKLGREGHGARERRKWRKELF